VFDSPDRRHVLGGLSGLAVTSLAPRAFAQPAAAQSFLVLGDWGRDGDRVQRQVAQGLARAAREIDSRFVLSVGDNFYPAGVHSVHDPQWRTSFEEVYVDPALQTPWFVALGNHDYRGAPRAQMLYSRLSPRWRMPGRYFTVGADQHGIAGLELFVLDTTPMIPSADESFQRLMHGDSPILFKLRAHHQMAWLRGALGRSQAPWKIVVGHHPVFSGGGRDTPELVDRLQPILAEHGVQLYLNGHHHDLQHIVRDGVDYVCSGSGSSVGTLDMRKGTQFYATTPGFVAVSVEPEVMRLDFRTADGGRLYGAEVARQRT
jgi:tartrate-resistant acid phosphatase type 5